MAIHEHIYVYSQFIFLMSVEAELQASPSIYSYEFPDKRDQREQHSNHQLFLNFRSDLYSILFSF
jgi:hypothetical protein